jgi:hypothetical protein
LQVFWQTAHDAHVQQLLQDALQRVQVMAPGSDTSSIFTVVF